MSHLVAQREAERLVLQARLDSEKSLADRNRLGQFATPSALAREVLRYGLALLSSGQEVRFLDPAVGTGSFYSALVAEAAGKVVSRARGFEIDSHYGTPARSLWHEAPLDITIADFTQIAAPTSAEDRANLLICNPPYVRHHHLGVQEKARLADRSLHAARIRLSGLAGLYCHFMALAHAWMAEGCVAGWLVPSEFMDVNYGDALKQYLLSEVTLLQIHRFDPHEVQFDDALVSSAVVWFRKQKPETAHTVRFSFGGSLQAPTLTKDISASDLAPADKWTRYPQHSPPVSHQGFRLDDLFAIKRGLATGDNKFFIFDESRARALNLPPQFLRPVLPSARYVPDDEIYGDAVGVPLLAKRLFLLDCDQPEDVVQRLFPQLWEYLETGLETVAQGYLCRSRRHWYAQENRPAAPIVCTYMGRSDHARRTFRFLLNNTKATATNVYLMLYPRPELAASLARDPELIRAVWRALNNIAPEILLGNGRVYGGGMHKLEPKELANVPADELAELAGLTPRSRPRQLSLIEAIAP